MANPYAVTPAGNFGSGLHGLASSVQNLSDQRAKQRAQEKFEKMKAGALTAYRSGNPDEIAEFMINNPEMAKALEVSYKFKSEETKKDYLSSAYKILEAHEKTKNDKTAPSVPRTPITATVPTGPINAAGEYPYDPGVLGLEEPSGTPFLNAEGKPIPNPGVVSPEMNSVIAARKTLLEDSGATPEQTTHTDAFAASYTRDPEATVKKIEHDIASMDPKGWKAWKEIYRQKEEEKSKSSSPLKKLIEERQDLLDEGIPKDDPRVKAYNDKIWPKEEEKSMSSSPLKKLMDERDDLLDEGIPKDDPRVKAYNDKIWPKEDDDKGVAPTEFAKLINEQAEFIDSGGDPESDIGKGFKNRILGSAVEKAYSPSPLKKLIKERQDYIEEGYKEDSDIIKAYNNNIAGIDIDIDELTQDEIDMWGAWVNLTGKMPSVGRGKQATKIRAAILKSAAGQALGDTSKGSVPNKTPAEAALEVVGTQADTKSIQGSLNFLEKQLGSMGSFIQNMDSQIGKVTALADDLYSFDARIMNVPLRFVRGKIVGSPLQAKYDMYLTEIEQEIGRLAAGASASIAELSTGAQERWDKIHDKNLSVKDMLSLLQETRHAADLRLKSVEDQLNRTRGKIRTRDYGGTEAYPEISSQEQYDALKSGDVYINQSTGKQMRKP